MTDHTSAPLAGGAAAFPNDADGQAFSAVSPPIAKAAGYKIVLSAAYTGGLQTYSSMISGGLVNNVATDTWWTPTLQPNAKITGDLKPAFT